VFPETPCPACPHAKAGRPGPCLAQTTRHARYCEHAEAGHEGFIRIILGGPQPAREASTTAVPRASWPLGVALVALLAREGDRGIGDTVARVIGPIGGDAFKAWYRRATGHDCGCGERQEALNATYPY
jgi:hypothetical protein